MRLLDRGGNPCRAPTKQTPILKKDACHVYSKLTLKCQSRDCIEAAIRVGSLQKKPRSAISVIAYDLATMEAIHKKSHLKLRIV